MGSQNQKIEGVPTAQVGYLCAQLVEQGVTFVARPATHKGADGILVATWTIELTGGY